MWAFRRRNLGLGGGEWRVAVQVESGFWFIFLGSVLHLFVI